MLGKAIRFMRNPIPYIEKVWYGWWMQPIVWPFQVWWYRKFILPRLIRSVSRKKQIRVLFLAMSVSYWKYDTVYRLMANDSRFMPMIMPAMRTNQSLDEQLQDHDELMKEFSIRGYNIVAGYDKIERRFISPNKLRPDIVFYTHPYSGAGRLRRKYDFWALRKSLICYSPYYFHVANDPFYFNQPIQNLAWQLYYPYKKILSIAKSAMRNKGVNVKIAGYCLGEEIAEMRKADADAAWRNDTTGRKRIIWAPHHSIDATDTVVRTSTFFEYCEQMKDIAVKYKDKVLIAFKPHPVLYSRLVRSWGKQKTDDYFDFWQHQENTMVQTGDYVALFCGSDAMIHDSGSFKCEYLYLNKPCMFLYRKDFLDVLNEIGFRALDAHYSGRSFVDIVEFIENVLLLGSDFKDVERRAFRDEYLTAPSGKMFSENVVHEILAGLGKE